nr:hypothetical protein [uncultured Mucilaginibacter sp.]
MKQLYLLLPAVLMLPFFAFAQKNFKQAYAVTLAGDTIKGEVDSRDLHDNPKQVKFKTVASNNISVLTPDNTQYLEVDGKQAYRRYAGFITLDHISEQQVLNERDTAMRLDTVFLKVLQKGRNLSLYSFSDHIKTRFYITEKDGEMPVELGYRLYYDSGKVNVYTGTGRTVNENTYLTQLYNIALKHNLMTPDMQRMLEWCRYTKSYIIEVVNTINGTKKK